MARRPRRAPDPAEPDETASTGWRIARYYFGSAPYRVAGPPPLLLRALGPLVVVSTLGLLGTGVLLVLRGENEARQTLVALLGFRVDWVTLHQAFFAFWAGAAGLHLAGRLVPALRATVLGRAPNGVPGSATRVLWLLVMAPAAAALAVVLVQADSSWSAPHLGSGDGPGGAVADDG